MKYLIIILFIGCSTPDWKTEWIRNGSALKQVVALIKRDSLKVVYGRSGYQIPDSFHLKSPYQNLAFRYTDFTYDSTYSILFFVDKRREAAIVYTNNRKRRMQYEQNSLVRKLEDEWYYTPAFASR